MFPEITFVLVRFSVLNSKGDMILGKGGVGGNNSERVPGTDWSVIPVNVRSRHLRFGLGNKSSDSGPDRDSLSIITSNRLPMDDLPPLRQDDPSYL